MNQDSKKQLLVVIRHTPYGSGLSRAALDTALAMAAFEQSVAVLFMGEGVTHLLEAQNSRPIGQKNLGKLLGSLPLYDIGSVYVEADSAERFGIDPNKAPLPLHLLDGPAIHNLMAASDHLLGF